jgi:hypothetical protein
LIIPQQKLLRILPLPVDHVAPPEPRTELTVGQDFFRTVPPARRHNPRQEPDELTLGQLTDPQANREKLLSKDHPPLGYGPAWLVDCRHPADPRTTATWDNADPSGRFQAADGAREHDVRGSSRNEYRRRAVILSRSCAGAVLVVLAALRPLRVLLVVSDVASAPCVVLR